MQLTWQYSATGYWKDKEEIRANSAAAAFIYAVNRRDKAKDKAKGLEKAPRTFLGK